MLMSRNVGFADILNHRVLAKAVQASETVALHASLRRSSGADLECISSGSIRSQNSLNSLTNGPIVLPASQHLPGIAVIVTTKPSHG